jgi:hypothetical protein
VPDKFHKGSQEKTTFPVAGVILAVQPAPSNRIALAFRSVSSGRYAQWRSAFGFLYQRAQSTAPMRPSFSKRLSGKALTSGTDCAGACLAYTSAMKCLTLASLGVSLLLPAAAIAQVKISVPAQHYRTQDEIHAKVENIGSRPATYCIEVGQTSPKANGTEGTPSPFWIEQYSRDKWTTLMIGPDVGGFRVVQVLEPGKSSEFPFHLNAHGKMRLRLNFWRGSIPNLDCNAPPKGSRLATSAVFIIE